MTNYTKSYDYSDVCIIKGYVDKMYHPNLCLVVKHVDPNGILDFSNWEMVGEVQRESTDDFFIKCVCSHTIKYEFIVEHKDTGDQLSVGSSCVHKFNKKFAKKTRSAILKHKNPDHRYCPTCYGKVRKRLAEKYIDEEHVYHKKCWELYDTQYKQLRFKIYFGKYRGYSMGDLMVKDMSYIRWLGASCYVKMARRVANSIIDFVDNWVYVDSVQLANLNAYL